MYAAQLHTPRLVSVAQFGPQHQLHRAGNQKTQDTREQACTIARGCRRVCHTTPSCTPDKRLGAERQGAVMGRLHRLRRTHPCLLLDTCPLQPCRPAQVTAPLALISCRPLLVVSLLQNTTAQNLLVPIWDTVLKKHWAVIAVRWRRR